MFQPWRDPCSLNPSISVSGWPPLPPHDNRFAGDGDGTGRMDFIGNSHDLCCHVVIPQFPWPWPLWTTSCPQACLLWGWPCPQPWGLWTSSCLVKSCPPWAQGVLMRMVPIATLQVQKQNLGGTNKSAMGEHCERGKYYCEFVTVWLYLCARIIAR